MKKFIKSFLVVFLIALCSLFAFLSFKTLVKSDQQFFVKTKIASGFNVPTDFAFTPDNRIFVTEKGGSVKVIKNGAVLSQSLIDLSVDNSAEKGVLGIVLDPNFSSNKFVYIYYVNASPLEIRVSRFTENNDQIISGSEVILLKSTQSLNSNHHGGTLRFGGDGKLWITTGNNSIPSNPQDLSNIHGKILRINTDGTIPSDNPFGSAIWAYGLRNPFRFNFLPDGRPIIGDVGEAAWEEINIGVKGGNYGFPAQEGSCNGCPYINPIFAYPHNNNSASVTGGFVNGKDYYFGDYAQGFIKKLTFDTQFSSITGEDMVDDQAGSVVELLPGSNNSFFFLTIFPGELYQMTPTSQGQPPTAKISASPIFGNTPLTVNFSSDGSSDPAGKPLTYFWDFGDGVTDTQQNPVHVYNNVGKYAAKLKVNNGTFDSIEETVDIHAGNFAPDVTINTPADGVKYNAGNTINFSGSATDKEDGTLPANNFSWEIIFHHIDHIHPYQTFNGVKSGSFVISDNNEVSSDTWYEIKLTVADSKGLKSTSSKRIDPNKVKVTIATNPQGLNFNLDGAPKTAPLTFDGVVGFKRNISAPTPQSLNGENFDFESWSDSGALSHVITTPSADSTITAKFKSAGTGNGDLRFRIQEWDENNGWTGKFINDAVVKLTDTSAVTTYQTQPSAVKDGQDGWVWFNDLASGTYGIMAYKPGFEGVWKQVDCNSTTGSFTNAVIQNGITEGMKAAWDNNAPVQVGKTTVCQDLGLKPITKGRLAFRITKVAKNDPSGHGEYIDLGFVNGATVKLTDTTGNNVIATTTSKQNSIGEDGWTHFENVQVGMYGIMAYKSGMEGEAKMVNCLYDAQKSVINNTNTEGQNAAWNNNVLVEGGKTTVCINLGLVDAGTKLGSVRIRIQEWDEVGMWTGKFINGATVKLTDTSGNTVISTLSSSAINGEDGWVWFDNIPVGKYGILAFKDKFEGVWKQVDCNSPGGSLTNATIQNSNTQGFIAAFDNDVSITENGVTVCQDLGLKNAVQKGSLRFRIQEWAADNTWTGKFINDAIVKLTDTLGNTIIATQNSGIKNSEDGWVWFDDIPIGTYGIMAYKNGFDGIWKQVDCNNPSGSLTNATINNTNTEGFKAAWDDNALIEAGKVTVCQDLGLKAGGSAPQAALAPQNSKTQEASESGQEKTIEVAPKEASPAASIGPSPSPEAEIKESSPSANPQS